MTKANGVSGVLVRHFFRRFFDSDTVSAEGDTVTTVVRAVSIAAAPGLIVAFFLQNQYPRRSMWGSIEDHYFFVLLTFVVLGAVAVFEWEMLFPDRLDFLILSPLSIRPLTMLGAKLAALAGFLGLFLFASSVFGAIVLPAVSKGDFPRQMMAHAAAVLMAGVFASLLFLAVGGGLICVLSASWFKVALPVVQTFSITALLLAMLHYFKCGDAMQAMLGHEPGMLRWMPPMWFLGVYEQVLRGDGAPAFAAEMTRYAVRGTLVAGVAVVVTYPLAWVRMQRMAMEGSGGRYGEPSRWLTRVQHWAVRRAETRGVFHFIGQTMRRSSRYQVYLAMYCGTGFALAVACAVTYRLDGAGVPRAGLASDGLRALTPLLLFWMVAGLRGAFAIPINLLARWVFRMAGVTMQVCAGAGRQWALVCSVGVLGVVLAVLFAAGWDARQLAVQGVLGGCLCVLLTDGFFFSEQSIPFNEARMPGRTSLPLVLTLYVGVLPPFILWMMQMDEAMEKRPARLVLVVLGTALIHRLIVALRPGPEVEEEELEGYDGEFQLLGLSRQ